MVMVNVFLSSEGGGVEQVLCKGFIFNLLVLNLHFQLALKLGVKHSFDVASFPWFEVNEVTVLLQKYLIQQL